MVDEAGAIRGGEKWSERRDHGNRGEAEIALAVIGFFEALDDASGGANGAPADAIIAGYDKASVQGFCVGENFGEEIGLRVGVVGVEHRGADAGGKLLLVG